MNTLSLNQFLLVYTWFPLTALLFFLLLIARQYQKSPFGKPTFFYAFSAPIVLFGAAAVRYASVNRLSGDILGNVLLGVAGVVLLFLSVRLTRLMLSN